jgi:y4mF family transcriptional regulator
MKTDILQSSDLGRLIRQKRKEDGLTIADASSLCGVGYRFLSELENGKDTAEIGKVLKVLSGLGLEITVSDRTWTDAV